VVKIPRFTFEKFEGADQTLGTQMKSVGEAMAIGRTFAEALQKACRSLELDRVGIFGGPEQKETNLEELKALIPKLTPTRLYLAAQALRLGLDVDELYKLTSYDPWFTREIRAIIEAEEELQEVSWDDMDVRRLGHAKRVGTSDLRVAQLCSVSEEEVVKKRHKLGLKPSFKRVDTCAAEFESFTPYLYSTYDAHGDYTPSDKKKIIILGGGPNRIGQGLEFDYCCVHAAFALREAGYETIMINCNPETVSTDYDTSDVLYFEPLTLEDVREIVEIEKPVGVIVQYGGQTPLKLAQALQDLGVPIIGTSPDSIDLTEDREKFRTLLETLELQQAESGVARNESEALEVAGRIGYPLMVRPSFVLGGRAMAVIPNEKELRRYISQSVSVSFDRPVLIDRFLDDAIEIDVDAVCDGERVVVAGIIEHIERAGIHSGDSTFLLPSQSISDEVRKEIENATRALAMGCGVRGLMNVQYALNDGGLYVLEVNPRASRSVPFVSKVMGIPWAKVAARVMAGESLAEIDAKGDYGNILAYEDYVKAVSRIPYIGVKESVFPFVKFRGVDALLGPEMRSTGEVMGIDDTVGGSFVRAQKGAGKALPMIGTAFVSVKDDDKASALEFCRTLSALGFQILATEGTANLLNQNGIGASKINKVREGSPHVVDRLLEGTVDLVINTPEGSGPLLDSRTIRTTAIEMDLPLFTTAAAATAAANAIKQLREGLDFKVVSIQERIASIAES
jgi:carbamoyl-phosphate synthase large subunit